ncbi:MAG: glycosyltransferase family 4 protein [Blastocatellia bacterium]|nr:glycosyltransferase family 4 protein [Blastocatellia bacterium]
MNLLHLSSGKTFGGGERHVLELVTALAARGHSLHVAVRPQSALREQLAAFPEIRLHVLGMRNALDVVSMTKLARLIQSERIAVVHAHYGRDYTLAAGAVRLARNLFKMECRLVLTRHHYLPLSSHPLNRTWLSGTDAAIAVSGSVRATLCASLGWPPDRVRVIPNWVNPEPFRHPLEKPNARQFFNLPQEGKLVGVINQLAPAKGQLEALQAVSHLATSFPNLHLVLAGTEHGGTTFTEELKAAARRMNLTERIHWLGFVTEVPKLLAALDIVLIPSWNEAFSLGALEALAAGVPVIASQVGGLAEILTHEQTALLVPPQNGKELATALHRLLIDEQYCKHLIQSGFSRVETEYTLERAVERVEKLYQEIEGSGFNKLRIEN